jgi:hypothetical protein
MPRVREQKNQNIIHGKNTNVGQVVVRTEDGYIRYDES